jgi:hypothetical protein
MKISIDISFLGVTVIQLELVLFERKGRVIPSEKEGGVEEQPFNAKFTWPESESKEEVSESLHPEV